MQRIIGMVKNRTVLIIICILLLCIIIALIAFMGVSTGDTPKKAVFV